MCLMTQPGDANSRYTWADLHTYGAEDEEELDTILNALDEDKRIDEGPQSSGQGGR